MKKNLIISASVFGAVLLLEYLITVIGFETSLFFFAGAVIEESFKYLGVKLRGSDFRGYAWTVASVFSAFEFFGSFLNGSVVTHHGLQLTWFLVIKALPHFLFASLFLWGARKSKVEGYMVATTSHIVWNILFGVIGLGFR